MASAVADPDRIKFDKPPDPHAHVRDGIIGSKSGGPTYASMVSGVPATVLAANRPILRPRFPPLALPTRQVGMKNGRPAISFTAAELGAGEKRFEYSLVAKFTVGRPSIEEIQAAFQQSWCLAGRATISGIFDGRHVLIILDSEADVKVALSSSLRKIGHAFFRLFRWSPDYSPKEESKVAAVWIRLTGLPLAMYDSSFVEAIVSTFGDFVAVDNRTKACVNVKYARACVELDVTTAIPDAVWISLPNDKGFWQPIEVENNLRYCSKCKIHGHSLSTCRKVKSYNVHPKVHADKSLNMQRSNAKREVALGGNQSVAVTIPGNGQSAAVEQWVPVVSKKAKKKLSHAAMGGSGEEQTALVNTSVDDSRGPLKDSLVLVSIDGKKEVNPMDLGSCSHNVSNPEALHKDMEEVHDHIAIPALDGDKEIDNLEHTPSNQEVGVEGFRRTSSPEISFSDMEDGFAHTKATDSIICSKDESCSPNTKIVNLRTRLPNCKIPKGSEHCPSMFDQ